MVADFKCVSYDPDSGWGLDGLNIRTPGGMGNDRLSIVMTGAGLSMAAMPRSSSWKDLVGHVANDLGVEISGENTLVDAMIISWSASRRRVSAEESLFQQAVANRIGMANVDERDRDLQKEFANFLRAIHCDVVVDLNYDNLVEKILEESGISYYRIIGAQLDIHPPLPEGTIVLWKVHGSIDYPATIVLSPTEYQRIYEANDLGAELSRLGSKAHTVWTVGVGLNDDDVWRYLMSQVSDADIVSFWITEKDKRETAHAELRPWLSAFDGGIRNITILNAAYEGNDRILLSALRKYMTEQVDMTVIHRAASDRSSAKLRDTLKRFDERWALALDIGTQTAMSSVVEEFASIHSDLVHFMLTRSDSKGSRWLPFLRVDEPKSRDALSKEFHAVLMGCMELKSKFAGNWPEEGLLLGNCVQTVVRNVFDWLESFDIPHEIERKREYRIAREIAEGERLLVGSNPFDPDVRADRRLFNLNHIFKITAKPLIISPPIVDKAPEEGSVESTGLLTEDEWECAIQTLFVRSNPRLKLIGQELIDLSGVAPVFPWGFGRKGLAEYRASFRGTVTEAWHLVSNRDSSGRQICKGGSLRDRGERAYMIGRRGFIRIGEFDDFVQRTTRIN